MLELIIARSIVELLTIDLPWLAAKKLNVLLPLRDWKPAINQVMIQNA